MAKKRCCPLLLLARLFLQVVTASASDLSLSTFISFKPPVLDDLFESGNATVDVALRVSPKEFENESSEHWNLVVSSIHPEIASSDDQRLPVSKSSFAFDNSTNSYSLDTQVTIHGRRLGKTAVRVRLVSAATWDETDDWWKNPSEVHNNALDVRVKRSPESERLTKYFVVSVVFLMIAGNVMMGCEIDVDVVWQTIRRPVAPLIGFMAQFIIMPLLSYGIAVTVFMPRGLYSMALGLFVTGCSPGGGASNFWTLLLDGNVNLSVTMTFLSTLASVVMMPFWISLLGVHFLQGFSSNTTIHVPYANIIRSLAALVLPLLIGVAIQKWKPNWAAVSKKILRPFIIFTLVFVIVFGAISNWYMFSLMTWPALMGGLLLPWCGFMFGCFVSIILRRDPRDVTAIAVETGIQNTGLSILILKASFAQPDAVIGAVLPVIVACFTPAPLLLGAAVHMAMEAIKKRRQQSIGNVKKEGVTLEPVNASQSSSLLVDTSKLESKIQAAVETP